MAIADNDWTPHHLTILLDNHTPADSEGSTTTVTIMLTSQLSCVIIVVNLAIVFKSVLI